MFREYLTYKTAQKMKASLKAMKLGYRWEVVYIEDLKNRHLDKKIKITHDSAFSIEPEELAKVLSKVMDFSVKFNVSFFASKWEKEFEIRISVR